MTVQQIERQVKKLSRANIAAFRDWFRRYDSDEWDRQIQRDIRIGKLEKLAKEAIASYKAGKVREL